MIYLFIAALLFIQGKSQNYTVCDDDGDCGGSFPWCLYPFGNSQPGECGQCRGDGDCDIGQACDYIGFCVNATTTTPPTGCIGNDDCDISDPICMTYDAVCGQCNDDADCGSGNQCRWGGYNSPGTIRISYCEPIPTTTPAPDRTPIGNVTCGDIVYERVNGTSNLVDYYRLTVNDTYLVAISTCDGVNVTLTDSKLYLYDASGSVQLDYNDDSSQSGCGYLSTIVEELDAGDYIIGVAAYDPSYSGSYGLSITCSIPTTTTTTTPTTTTPPCQNDADCVGSPYAGANATCGLYGGFIPWCFTPCSDDGECVNLPLTPVCDTTGLYPGQCVICNGDDDCDPGYECSSGFCLEVTTTTTPPTACTGNDDCDISSPICMIYDAVCGQCNEDADCGDGNQCRWGGYNRPGSIFVSYCEPIPTTTTTTTTPPDRTPIANVTCGDVVEGALNSSNFADYYRLTVDDRYDVVISTCVDGTFPSLSDTKLYLYDASGSSQLAFNDDGCGLLSQIEETLNASDYIIGITPYSDSYSGSYAASIKCRIPGETTTETPTTTTPPCTSDRDCALDGLVCASGLCIVCRNDTDCENSPYAGEVATCGLLNGFIPFCFTGCSDDTACEGLLTPACDETTNTCVFCVDDEDCDDGYECRSNDCYEVTTTTTETPVDVSTIVGNVTCGSLVNGTINSRAQVDLYYLMLDEAAEVNVTTCADGYPPLGALDDTVLYIYNENGVPLYENDNSGPCFQKSTIVKTLDAGAYIIGVAAYDPFESGEYLLLTTCSEPLPPTTTDDGIPDPCIGNDDCPDGDQCTPIDIGGGIILNFCVPIGAEICSTDNDCLPGYSCLIPDPTFPLGACFVADIPTGCDPEGDDCGDLTCYDGSSDNIANFCYLLCEDAATDCGEGDYICATPDDNPYAPAEVTTCVYNKKYTDSPTMQPSMEPTVEPTDSPTMEPTEVTGAPSAAPTEATDAPTPSPLLADGASGVTIFGGMIIMIIHALFM